MIGTVYYKPVLHEGRTQPGGLIAFLSEEPPYVWRESYLEKTPRPTNIIRWQYGTFEYIYDDYASLERTAVVPYHATAEARLVAALGLSQPHPGARDDYRLKGWVGATEKRFGRSWEQGSFHRTFHRRCG